MQQSDSRFHSLRSAIQEFLRLESTGGLLVLGATLLALLVANSPLVTLYQALLEIIGVLVGLALSAICGALILHWSLRPARSRGRHTSKGITTESG